MKRLGIKLLKIVARLLLLCLLVFGLKMIFRVPAALVIGYLFLTLGLCAYIALMGPQRGYGAIFFYICKAIVWFFSVDLQFARSDARKTLANADKSLAIKTDSDS